MYSTRIDITGQKFNRLTVIEYSHTKGNAYWKCCCECGNETVVVGTKLRSGHTKSCGCLLVESRKECRITHGMSRSDEHNTWCWIKTRCYNVNSASYPYYGGRGIIICPEWLESFDNFYKDMGPKPGPQYSLDRIDNNGNYEPNNCRWATQEEQANNKTSNVEVTYNGKTQNISQWARELKIQATTIRARLRKGWAVGDALSRPIWGRGSTKRINNK